MTQTTYYAEKSAGTFADALMAFGAAFVLQAVLKEAVGEEAEVRLVDVGPAYALELSTPLRDEWLDQCKPFTPASFLATQKNAKKLPPDALNRLGGQVRYEEERQKKDDYWAVWNSLPAEAKQARMRGTEHRALDALVGKGIPQHWEIYRALNPSALDTYNNVVTQWWLALPAFPDLLRVLLYLLSEPVNESAGAAEQWAKVCKARGLEKPKEVTAAQLFNPTQGKGQNRPKPDGARMENVGNFWLPEYLKVVGLYQAGLTRIVANPSDPRNAKDRKTYVLAPRDISFGVHSAIMERFRQAMAGSDTAVKLDVLAALRYTQAFLQYAAESRAAGALEIELGQRPNDLVTGLQMAFYKNLGQSAATMNIAFINLPTWVRVGIPEEMQAFQDVLREHMIIIRALDETRSEIHDLLAGYRDFLSGDSLSPFFMFTTGYSAVLMRTREGGRSYPSFTTTNLEVLLMNTTEGQSLSEIVQSEGFRNIAYAIRQSTVVPQRQKEDAKRGKGPEPIYDVRYGLGQRLSRKAQYEKDFLAELSAFLQEYSVENGQQYERHGRYYRRIVREDDITEIVRLVDKFGSQVVCNMLVAFGYASGAKKTGVSDQNGMENDADNYTESGDEE
ncbi:MAG: hypothetical protein KIT87_11990 [Anaerolineae bacterium]|nr:hypothetical protein [Anaerolineae bacterium]